MELAHKEFITIESGKSNKDVNILVVTDHFTRQVQAFITPSQTAKVVTQMLWDKYFVYYGSLETIISDQE